MKGWKGYVLSFFLGVLSILAIYGLCFHEHAGPHHQGEQAAAKENQPAPCVGVLCKPLQWSETAWRVIDVDAEPIIAVGTLLLFTVTGLLWYSTYRLASEAKEASERQHTQTVSALAVAKTAADAADKNAEATQLVAQSAQNADRGWIVPTKIRLNGWAPETVQNGGEIELSSEFSFENFGRSPVFIVRTHWKMFRLPEAEALPILPDDSSAIVYAAPHPLRTGEPVTRTAHLRGPIRTLEEVRDIESWETGLILIGFLEYKDVFGNIHETRFCVSWLVQGVNGNPTPQVFGGPAYNKYT